VKLLYITNVSHHLSLWTERKKR